MTPPPVDPRELASLRGELAVATARQREAAANLSEAESAQARAEREAARREQLFQQGAVSAEAQEQYEQEALAAQARLETARASLRASRAEVERVGARLAAVDRAVDPGRRFLEPVVAPVAGTVLTVYEESERVVQAGEPLFELRNAEGLEIVVDLLTEQAVRVRPGAEAEITGWGGGRTIPGRVRHVEPKGFEKISALGVEEQRVNVIVDLLEVPEELGAEFRVEVAIVTWEGTDVVTVPTSAIFRRANGWWAFVDEAGRARLQRLEIGRRGAERAEALAGLTEGDSVVVFPSDLVEDGVRLAARPADEASPR